MAEQAGVGVGVGVGVGRKGEVGVGGKGVGGTSGGADNTQLQSILYWMYICKFVVVSVCTYALAYVGVCMCVYAWGATFPLDADFTAAGYKKQEN